MHSAVLQNKKYISFAEKNTVEVIALGSLDKGIEAQDKRAETYKAKGPDGKELEYLVEYPGMTPDEMLALSKSKAATYNKSGKIPYTSIVDPWTLEEVEQWIGGQGAKTIMTAATAKKKTLAKSHGAGISRKNLERLNEAEREARDLAKEGSFKKAFRVLEKMGPADELPEVLKKRVDATRQDVTTAAKLEVDRVAELCKTDPKAAKRALRDLQSEMRGTEFEERVSELLKSLASDS